MTTEAEESNDEKIMNYFRLKQDYFEERKKIINNLYKKQKFIQSTNENKRLEIKQEMLESSNIRSILSKMQKIKNAKNKKK